MTFNLTTWNFFSHCFYFQIPTWWYGDIFLPRSTVPGFITSVAMCDLEWGRDSRCCQSQLRGCAHLWCCWGIATIYHPRGKSSKWFRDIFVWHWYPVNLHACTCVTYVNSNQIMQYDLGICLFDLEKNSILP